MKPSLSRFLSWRNIWSPHRPMSLLHIAHPPTTSVLKYHGMTHVVKRILEFLSGTLLIVLYVSDLVPQSSFWGIGFG